jgi:ribokinase
MELIILGTVALDDIETPFGNVKEVLGGSASYAAYAARFFFKSGIISVIGKDFPQQYVDFLKNAGIDFAGVKIESKTFRWQGFYEFDMNEAKTIRTEHNSLKDFDVDVPKSYKDAKYVFLANIDPELQLETLSQLRNPELIVIDTMNFWIQHKKDSLLKAIKKSHILLLNDAEARQLFNTSNLIKASNLALSYGLKAVIIKKGEHGALLFTKNKHFSAAGYPLENIKDPTGSGDSFGGGFIGYLAKTKDMSETNMRKAVVYGSVIASFNTEDFSLNRLKTLTMVEIEKRFHEFRKIREF